MQDTEKALILDQLAEAVIYTDERGKILYFNSKAGELFQIKPDSQFDDAILICSKDNIPVVFGDLVRNKDFTGLTKYYKKLEEGKVSILTVLVGTLQIDDEPNYIFTFRDTTLCTKIEQTTHNAAKLDAIGMLAGNIAHDFNNILSGLFGYLQLAREAVKDAPSISHLDEAGRVFQKAKTLTQQLMTFSKGGQLNRKPTHLPIIIQDTISLVSLGNKATINYDFPPALWQTMADEQQLAIVIDNIVINAIQASGNEGEIKIEAENVDNGSTHYPILGEKQYVLVKFSDKGKGIPEQNIDKIFDPFFTTQKRKNGLGLSTAFSIIKGHEGFLTVESSIGVGTTFYLYMPALTETKEEHLERKQGDGLYNTRILIMDDEDFIRDVARQLLQKMGFKVTCASNSQTTLQLYKASLDSSHPYDIVILDLTIPSGTGGLETLQSMQKINKDVRAIASSGYAEDPAMTDPKSFGFKSALVKPYTKDDLSESITAALLNN